MQPYKNEMLVGVHIRRLIDHVEIEQYFIGLQEGKEIFFRKYELEIVYQRE